MSSKETKMHKCVMENKAKAKVGDTIVVTNKKYPTVGHKCTVIDDITYPFGIDTISECVWVTENNDIEGGIFWLYHSDYEIVQLAKPIPLVSCPDCKGTGQIVLSTSTVNCKCCNSI